MFIVVNVVSGANGEGGGDIYLNTAEIVRVEQRDEGAGEARIFLRDGSALDVESSVNGERRQRSNTRELIFSLDRLVEFVTGVMTLLPGDIIATGTPSGVGPLVAGDRVVVKIEGIGELANDVVADEG